MKERLQYQDRVQVLIGRHRSLPSVHLSLELMKAMDRKETGEFPEVSLAGH